MKVIDFVSKMLQYLGNMDEIAYVRMVERDENNVVTKAWIAPVQRITNVFVKGRPFSDTAICIEKSEWREIVV